MNTFTQKRLVVAGIVVLCVAVVMGLAEQPHTHALYRLARWQTPGPLTHQHLPARGIAKADHPFSFSQGPPSDIGTLEVRDVDGSTISLVDYLDRRRVLAFIVIRDDAVVYERYLHGFSPAAQAGLFSVTKSFVSALAGIAMAKREINGLDDELVSYIPELAGNESFLGITIGDLLAMRSGLAYTGFTGSLVRDAFTDEVQLFYTSDIRGHLASMSRRDPPGAKWAYKDSDTELLAWVLERATGKPLAQQLEERIWSRIGTEADASWSLDRSGGVERAASGLNTTARDLARFGRLYLHEGRWDGEQIVPTEWVRASTTLRSSGRPDIATWWGMKHTLLWWLPTDDWARHRDFYADGHAGQRLYVHPPTKTIIVQIADDSVQDFPFRQITTVLADAEAAKYGRQLRDLHGHANPEAL